MPRRRAKGGRKDLMNTLELANRIFDLDPYGAMDADATPESIEQEIKNDPESVIKYLLDYIDELQA